MAVIVDLAADINSQKTPLLPEMWVIILSYLKKPRPAPLSRPLRSELRQPDLCQAMLVCRVFYDICQPILYKNVTTDNLSGMLQNISLPGMQHRFAQTTTLCVEYHHMGSDLSYREVLGIGRAAWDGIGRAAAVMEMSKMTDCEVRTNDLMQNLFAVIKMGTTTIFPKLKTVSVSSLYGVESNLWNSFELWCVHAQSPTMFHCAGMFDQFLKSSNIEHLCIRESQGPLLITPMTQWRDQKSRTLHFDLTIPRLPLVIDSENRFVSDIPLGGNFPDVLTHIGGCFEEARKIRNGMSKRGTAHVSIYCSTYNNSQPSFLDSPNGLHLASSIPAESDLNLTGVAQRDITSKAGAKIQSFLRASSGVKDIVQFYPSAEIGICVACGSGAPQ